MCQCTVNPTTANEQVLKEMTVIAYYEDPGLQQALKELLYRPDNKALLLKFEQSLPSWTVVLAQYTGKYRAWMRHTVRIICFIASCITLSIACYDLYRNFPVLKSFLDTYFAETHVWLEEIFKANTSALMGCFLYVAWPLTFVYETLSQSQMFLFAFNSAMYPFIYVGSSLLALFKLIFDLFWPVKALISIVFRWSFQLVWSIICLPYTILYFMYSCCFGMIVFIRSFSSSVETVSQVAPSAIEAQETFSMIAYGTQICMQWSQSITNKVMRASKSVYDFVVYVGCEIGKHNYTIQVYIYDRSALIYKATTARVRKMATSARIKLFFKMLKLLLYCFVTLFVVNMIFVFLRERFELQGCVLCIDQEVDRI